MENRRYAPWIEDLMAMELTPKNLQAYSKKYERKFNFSDEKKFNEEFIRPLEAADFDAPKGLLYRINYVNLTHPSMFARTISNALIGSTIAEGLSPTATQQQINSLQQEIKIKLKNKIPVLESEIKIPWIQRLALMDLNKDSIKAFMDDLFNECKAAAKPKNESLIDTFSRIIINPFLESNLVPTQNLLDRLNYLNKRVRTTYSEKLFFYMIDQAAFAAANAKLPEPLTRLEAEYGPHTDFLVVRAQLGRFILDNCEHRLNTLEDIPVSATPREVIMTAIIKMEGIGQDLKNKGDKVNSEKILQLAAETRESSAEFFKKPIITPDDAKLFHKNIKMDCDAVILQLPKDKLPQWKAAINTLLQGAAAAANFGMRLIGAEFAKKHTVKPTLFSNESEGHKKTRALKTAAKTVLPKSKRPNSPS